MSSLSKRVQKAITSKKLMFDVDMYTNVVGSLVITAYMLSENKPEPNKINKAWRKLKKNGMDYWLEDKEFIQKTLAKFGLEMPPYGSFAMVQSELNVLFLPYIDGQLYPVREDGLMPNTAYTGKIYPIVKEGEALNDVDVR